MSLRALRRWFGWFVLLGVAGSAGSCSQNFGTAPDDSGTVAVGLSEEAFAGPGLPRAATALAAGGGRFLLGTDRGAYVITGDPFAAPAPSRWFAGPPSLALVGIRAVAVDPSGRVALVEGLAPRPPAVSIDGGRTFAAAFLTVGITTPLDAVAALGPGTVHPSGAFLLAKGTALWLGVPVDDPDRPVHWEQLPLPVAPVEWGPVAGDGSGRLSASTRDAAGNWAVWLSVDSGRTWSAQDPPPGGRVLALTLTGAGEAVFVTAGSIPQVTVVAASLWPGSAQVEYAAITTDDRLVLGRLGAAPTAGAPIEVTDLAAIQPVALPGGGAVATRQAGLQIARGDGAGGLAILDVDFAGGALDWTALAADPRQRRRVYLGNRDARVWRGSSQDGFVALDRPYASSLTALLPDLDSAEGVYWGAFGVAHLAAPLQPWERRNGCDPGPDSCRFCSYLFQNFCGWVQTRVLATDPRAPAELWLGASDGDGPYFSPDGGRTWQRPHEGLGQAASLPGEDGLPLVTEVRGFAFPDGEVWMATLRGGVWRWEATLGRWEQKNLGLPGADGAAVDTCCSGSREEPVDVRDLAARSSGGLLAATAWGVFRDDQANGVWTESSFGLSTRDCYSLMENSEIPGWWILAGRGSETNPRYLFLSQDDGRTWRELDTFLRGRFASKVVWSDPARGEVTALLESSGAWRMVVRP